MDNFFYEYFLNKVQNGQPLRLLSKEEALEQRNAVLESEKFNIKKENEQLSLSSLDELIDQNEMIQQFSQKSKQSDDSEHLAQLKELQKMYDEVEFEKAEALELYRLEKKKRTEAEKELKNLSKKIESIEKSSKIQREKDYQNLKAYESVYNQLVDRYNKQSSILQGYVDYHQRLTHVGLNNLFVGNGVSNNNNNSNTNPMQNVLYQNNQFGQVNSFSNTLLINQNGVRKDNLNSFVKDNTNNYGLILQKNENRPKNPNGVGVNNNQNMFQNQRRTFSNPMLVKQQQQRINNNISLKHQNLLQRNPLVNQNSVERMRKEIKNHSVNGLIPIESYKRKIEGDLYSSFSENGKRKREPLNDVKVSPIQNDYDEKNEEEEEDEYFSKKTQKRRRSEKLNKVIDMCIRYSKRRKKRDESNNYSEIINISSSSESEEEEEGDDDEKEK